MVSFKKLDETLSVCGQVSENEVIMAAGLKYKTLVNNRPDGEAVGQPSSDEVKNWALKHGLAYHYLPVHPNEMQFDTVAEFGEIYQFSENPILAFCTTGMRSSVLWSYMMAVISDGDIDEILAQPASCGFDLSTLRDPLVSVREIVLANSEQLS
jgi:uncharacterized protein (TIGR01244 family)